MTSERAPPARAVRRFGPCAGEHQPVHIDREAARTTWRRKRNGATSFQDCIRGVTARRAGTTRRRLLMESRQAAANICVETAYIAIGQRCRLALAAFGHWRETMTKRMWLGGVVLAGVLLTGAGAYA